MAFELDRRSRRDPVRDSVDQLGGKRTARAFDRLRVRVEGKHVRCVLGDGNGEPAVAAAELEHTTVAKVAETAQCGEVRSFGVEHRRQREPGLASGL